MKVKRQSVVTSKFTMAERLQNIKDSKQLKTVNQEEIEMEKILIE